MSHCSNTKPEEDFFLKNRELIYSHNTYFQYLLSRLPFLANQINYFQNHKETFLWLIYFLLLAQNDEVRKKFRSLFLLIPGFAQGIMSYQIGLSLIIQINFSQMTKHSLYFYFCYQVEYQITMHYQPFLTLFYIEYLKDCLLIFTSL